MVPGAAEVRGLRPSPPKARRHGPKPSSRSMAVLPPPPGTAAPPEQAEPLYERLCAELRELGVPVETGVFGARMAVELVNDGPVTIVLE